MFSPDEINRYFVGSNSSANFSVDLMANESYNSFAFSNICEDDLFSAICQVKSESSGLDNISIKFVKRVFPYVSKYLLHTFNYILTTSSYPDQWRHSKVVPISKVSNPTDLSHFRPISILSSISKVFEVVIKNQIESHLFGNNLLNSFQSGFRKYHRHSTTSALLNV